MPAAAEAWASWHRVISDTGEACSLQCAVPRRYPVWCDPPLPFRRSLSLLPPSAKSVGHLHEDFVNDASTVRCANSTPAISLIFSSAITGSADRSSTVSPLPCPSLVPAASTQRPARKGNPKGGLRAVVDGVPHLAIHLPEGSPQPLRFLRGQGVALGHGCGVGPVGGDYQHPSPIGFHCPERHGRASSGIDIDVPLEELLVEASKETPRWRMMLTPLPGAAGEPDSQSTPGRGDRVI